MWAGFIRAVAIATVMAAPPALAHMGEDYIVCNLNPAGGNYLALRSCASTKCDMIMKLPPKTSLKMLNPFSTEHWRKVTVRSGLQHQNTGPTGWVVEKYICELAH